MTDMTSPSQGLREAAQQALKALSHWSTCDFPDEVDFRCDGCNEARAAEEALRLALSEPRKDAEQELAAIWGAFEELSRWPDLPGIPYAMLEPGSDVQLRQIPAHEVKGIFAAIQRHVGTMSSFGKNAVEAYYREASLLAELKQLRAAAEPLVPQAPKLTRLALRAILEDVMADCINAATPEAEAEALDVATEKMFQSMIAGQASTPEMPGTITVPGDQTTRTATSGATATKDEVMPSDLANLHELRSTPSDAFGVSATTEGRVSDTNAQPAGASVLPREPSEEAVREFEDELNVLLWHEVRVSTNRKGVDASVLVANRDESRRRLLSQFRASSPLAERTK